MSTNPALSTEEPIAIVGMACIFPGAPDLATYWANILNGVDAVGEAEPGWGAQRYLADGRIATARGGVSGRSVSLCSGAIRHHAPVSGWW